VSRWPYITIYLMHFYPPSKGARVIVMSSLDGGRRHVVSSPSGEGMTIDDPNIQSFMAWAKQYYDGARVIEVAGQAGGADR